jgi:NAD-dependent deacetylase
MMRKAEPNRGHRAVAKLVDAGKVAAVVTQNIDGLHQASGVPADKVIELHGNATYAACLDCGLRHELEAIRELFANGEILPDCRECGGIVKTATISFGQAMPEAAMQRAYEETLLADLFIVAGSSLVVYPAAGFPLEAKRNGARLVIVNRDETDQDRYADLVVQDSIGTVLGDAVGVN